MNLLRPAIIGIVAGALMYAGLTGFVRPGDSQTAVLSDMVTESVSPVLSPKSKVTGGDKKGDKIADKQVSPVLSPFLSVTPIANISVTPRISILPPLITPSNTPLPSVSPILQITPRIATPIPTPTPTPLPTPTPTPQPSPTPLPTPIPTPEATPSPAPDGPILVVINEIAWAGTATSSSDEWIELFNAGESSVDVSGWTIHGDPDANGNTRIITLSGSIGAGQYYLIERTDDTTVSDIPADLVGAFGGSGLRNNLGEDMQLRDNSGAVVDRVNCSGISWFAGSAGPEYASMQRISPMGNGSDPANWVSNDGSMTTGLDATGVPLRGTPKYRNY
jgi:lamin tail-like protein